MYVRCFLRISTIFIVTLYHIGRWTKCSSQNDTTPVDQSYRMETLPRICPYRPMCTVPAANVLPAGQYPCCEACSCYPHCQLLGNCCPDYAQMMNPESDASLKAAVRLTKDMFTCQTASTHSLFTTAYFMVSKCPEGASAEMITDCETSRPTKFKQIVPLTHTTLGITFKNQFCALCNGVNIAETVEWGMLFGTYTPSILTADYIGSTFSSLDELLVKRLGKIYYLPPESDTAVTAHDRCRTRSRWDSCNLTGTWSQNIHSLERACMDFTVPYQGHSKNVFCHLCNKDKVDTICTRPTYVSIHGGGFAFTVLLTLTETTTHDSEKGKARRTSTENDTCPNGYAQDTYKGFCRQVYCPAGKIMVQGHCQPLLTQINNIEFFVALKIEKYVGDMTTADDKYAVLLVRECFAHIADNRRDIETNVLSVARTSSELRPTQYIFGLALVNAGLVPDLNILEWYFQRLREPFIHRDQNGKTSKMKLSLHSRIRISNLNTFELIIADPNVEYLDLEHNVLLDIIYLNDDDCEVQGIATGMLFTKLIVCEQFAFNQSEYVTTNKGVFLASANITLYPNEYVLQYNEHNDPDQIRTCIDHYQGGQDWDLNDVNHSGAIIPSAMSIGWGLFFACVLIV